MRRRTSERQCRNPRCGETFNRWDGGDLTGLCPSCRLAGQYGAGLVFVLFAAWKLLLLVW